MAYNLWKLQIDSIKIEAWATLSLLISEPLKLAFAMFATAKLLIKKQWIAIVKFAKTLNRY